MEGNHFTILCCFPPYNKVNQPCIMSLLLTYHHLIPQGHYRALDWAPCVTQQLSTSYLFCLCSCIDSTGLEKVSFYSNLKQRQCQKSSNYCTIALISHASKVMLKILQARLQQYVNHELPDVQAGFRKGRRTRDQIANIRWIMEKGREFPKNTYFCFID